MSDAIPGSCQFFVNNGKSSILTSSQHSLEVIGGAVVFGGENAAGCCSAWPMLKRYRSKLLRSGQFFTWYCKISRMRSFQNAKSFSDQMA